MMNLNEKSRVTSLILTILLGPIGLLYTSVLWGLVLIVIAVLSFPTIIGPIICWVLAIAIGDHCAHRHNQGLEKFKAMMSSK